MLKNWQYRNNGNDKERIKDISEELGVYPSLVELMLNRGIETSSEMQAYLYPDLRRDLATFSKYPGLSEVVEILSDSLSKGKRIAIWGDYDVDGITGTALLNDFLRQRGYSQQPVRNYFPDRFKEGYGLSLEGMKFLIKDDIDTLVTVDCGISNHQEVAFAKENGMTVLVTDHHEPDKASDLPEADAIFNPRISECPCPDLAGVGVAFYVAAALNKKLPGNSIPMHFLLDLVALGTIADIVPLVGTNRVLTRFGLDYLSKGVRPGIFAMKEVNGLGGQSAINPGQVSFRLAPMINAAGRLSDPYIAFKCLLAKDHKEVQESAKALQSLNQKRKTIEEKHLEEALTQAKQQENDLGIIVYSSEWHEGVIGIVASKIVETYYRPVLILTKGESGDFKGSARSIPEVDIHQALTDCRESLVGFGGHKQAAGLQVKEENIPWLKELFCEAIKKQIGPDLKRPTQKIDGTINARELSLDFVNQLDLLQPCGMGNPGPVFQTEPLNVHEKRPLGKDGLHILVKAKSEEGVSVSCKGWHLKNAMSEVSLGNQISFVCVPKVNEWQGNKNVELDIKDFRKES